MGKTTKKSQDPPEISSAPEEFKFNGCTEEQLKKDFYPAFCAGCGFEGCSCEWQKTGKDGFKNLVDPACPICGRQMIDQLPADHTYRSMTIPEILQSHNGTLSPYITKRLEELHAISVEYDIFQQFIRNRINYLREQEDKDVTDLLHQDCAPGTIQRRLKTDWIRDLTVRRMELEDLLIEQPKL